MVANNNFLFYSTLLIRLHAVKWVRVVFANGPGDLGSIPGRVIPKTQKMVLDASLLNTQHYKVRIKGKVEQSREGVALSPTPWCCSYRKGSLQVTLDYGRQLYLLTLLICISNNSIKHQSFAYTQLNDQTVLFLTIQFSIRYLFARSLNVKQFYLTYW